jgi:class 3 adenylate cyclase
MRGMTSAGQWIVVAEGSADERSVAINGRLLVGRVCAGAEPTQALIISDPGVSRDHFEIREGAPSTLIDLSTNGTLINGRRVERGAPTPLQDGDQIELAGVTLAFRADLDEQPVPELVESTVQRSGATTLAIVVGDIVGYTGLTETYGGVRVAEATDALFRALADLLKRHHGTISNFAGDAIFAAWDARRDQEAARRAIEFALTAEELVADAASTSIRDVAGEPLRMGWAVTLGDAGVGRPGASHETLHGDAVILAFRVSGLAGRGGREPVLVSARAAAAAPRAAAYGPLEEIHPKGYSSVTWIRTAARPA